MFVHHAICIWCVSVALMTVASLGLTVWAATTDEIPAAQPLGGDGG